MYVFMYVIYIYIYIFIFIFMCTVCIYIYINVNGKTNFRAPKSEQISLHLLLCSLLFGMQAAHVTRVAPVKEAVGLGTAMTGSISEMPLS